MRKTPRHFGRVLRRDPRDAKFRVRFKATPRRSRYWDDSHWFGDQGATPHCVGYAWSHFLSSEPVRGWANPDGIYELAKYRDEWEGEDYDGTSVRAGAKVLQAIGAIDSYRWAVDIKTLTSALLNDGPVVVGTHWLEGMQSPNRAGLIEATGGNLGGHSYLLSGINLNTGKIRLKNSWGKSWGKGGRAFITITDFAKLLAREGEACLAIQKSMREPT